MFSSIFDLGFWFDLTPVRMGPVFEASFFVLFAACLIVGAVIRMAVRNRQWEKYDSVVLRRLASIASTAGIVGFVLLFLAFEEIQFFGARFWMLAWFVGVTAAVVSVARYVKMAVPEMRNRKQSRAEVNKYLPRRSR